MALIREMISEYMVFAYKGRKTKPMKRKRGARQGGPDSMDGFALAFDVCVEDLFNHWNYLKYGFEYDNDAHVTNIQQADDLYIISSS